MARGHAAGTSENVGLCRAAAVSAGTRRHPLVLVGNCQEHINSLYPNPALAPMLPLPYWREFLMNGGRAVLSILCACLAVAGHYLLKAFRIVEPDRNAPCICGSGKKYKQCCMPP